jgi:hypothetical protein
MRYDITERSDEVEIRVREIGDGTPQVHALLQDCQQGRCRCPTDQYDRLAGIDVEIGDDEVGLKLHPRAGQQLDVNALQACLHYTLAEASNQ